MQAYFSEHGQRVVYDKNQMFMRADDPRPWVYFPVEGLVSATFKFEDGQECILGYFTPGTVFAQNKSFYENDGGNLDFIAVSKCVMYRVHRDEFLKQVYSDWDFNKEYMANTQKIRIFTTDRAICLAESRIYNRCIRWLMLMVQYYSEPYNDSKQLILIPLTQETIAKFMSVSRESISKVLHKLVREGHLTVKNKRIIVHDPAGLHKLLEA